MLPQHACQAALTDSYLGYDTTDLHRVLGDTADQKESRSVVGRKSKRISLIWNTNSPEHESLYLFLTNISNTSRVPLSKLLSKVGDLSRGWSEGSLFNSYCTEKRGWRYSIPWIAPIYHLPYLIILSVKQGGIKYHFLSLWYDSI